MYLSFISTTSLVLSGLPSHNFFGGFLEKQNEKTMQLKKAFDLNFTSLRYESPNRLSETLKLLIDINDDMLISVLRELTKLNEEVITGSPSYVYFQINKNKIKGEIVLAISNKNEIHYTKEMILDLIKKILRIIN